MKKILFLIRLRNKLEKAGWYFPYYFNITQIFSIFSCNTNLDTPRCKHIRKILTDITVEYDDIIDIIRREQYA